MMATVCASSFNILDILECPMCKETVKVPKVLSCIHTFCLQCLDSYCAENNNSENKYACPVCIKIFSIPEGGIKHISDNVFIQRMLVAKTLAESQSLDKQPACELCLSFENETPSTSYCIDCAQRMCDRCRVSHRNAKVSQSHRVMRHISILSSAKNAKAGLTYCDQHTSEVERLYCYNCKKVMCYMCVSAHSKHELTDVEKSASKLRKQLKKSIEVVQAHVSQKRKDNILLENGKKSFVKATICDQSRNRNLKHDTNQFKERILTGIRYSIDAAEYLCVMVENFMGYCIEIMDKGTACEISRVAHKLLARAEELIMIHKEHVYEKTEIKSATQFTKSSKGNFFGVQMFKDQPATIPKTMCERRLNLKSLLQKPISARIIKTDEITGLTILSNIVYIVRADSQIDVYESNNLSKRVREIPIPGSKNLNGIISSANHNYLYAVDFNRALIFRYDLTNDLVVAKFNVEGIVYLLSLTNDCNILCMTLDDHECQYLEEYSTQGTLLRVIDLDSSIYSLQHCVQIANGNYVISHSGGEHQICIINQHGIIQAVHKPPPGSVSKPINPVYMCVDTLDNVLVVDGNDNKVLLLSSKLSHLGYVDLSEHEMFNPESLHLDELNHRLFIKDYNGEQLLVVDIEAKF